MNRYDKNYQKYEDPLYGDNHMITKSEWWDNPIMGITNSWEPDKDLVYPQLEDDSYLSQVLPEPGMENTITHLISPAYRLTSAGAAKAFAEANKDPLAKSKAITNPRLFPLIGTAIGATPGLIAALVATLKRDKDAQWVGFTTAGVGGLLGNIASKLYQRSIMDRVRKHALKGNKSSEENDEINENLDWKLIQSPEKGSNKYIVAGHNLVKDILKARKEFNEAYDDYRKSGSDDLDHFFKNNPDAQKLLNYGILPYWKTSQIPAMVERLKRHKKQF